MKGGEERGFTAAEYKGAQRDGWEKQYLYWISKKKKEYMTPSAAEAKGLERASKYVKITKYGRPESDLRPLEQRRAALGMA